MEHSQLPTSACAPDHCCTCSACVLNPYMSAILVSVQGELWRAPDRIGYEWSMAGYQQGNPLPLPAVTHNLKTNFGARGDGVTDDTQALVNALNNITRGVLLIPAGESAGCGWVGTLQASALGGASCCGHHAQSRAGDALILPSSSTLQWIHAIVCLSTPGYLCPPPCPPLPKLHLPGTYILTSVINWRKPIIIRGEGRSRTILRWPKSLTDLYGNTWVEGKWVGTSQYSHGTGLMNIGGWDPSGRDFSFIVNVTRVSGRVTLVA